MLENMTLEDFQTPIRSKLDGTRNLASVFDGTSTDESLSFFLLLSSVVGTIGSRGQANYAAASACLDAFAHEQSKKGATYVSLDLGAIENAGVNNDIRLHNLTSQGLVPLKQSELPVLFEYAMSEDDRRSIPCQIVTGFDEDSISRANISNASVQHPLFSHSRKPKKKVGEEAQVSQASFKDQLGQKSSLKEVERLVTDVLLSKISDLLSFTNRHLNANMSLIEVGLDSLIVIELRDWIRKEFQAELSTTEILDQDSFRILAQKIVQSSQLIQGAHLSEVHKSTNAQGETGANNTENRSCPALPRQPFPKLQNSLKQLLDSRRPFISDEEFERFEGVVEEFAADAGSKLQDRLRIKAEDPRTENWQANIYAEKIYLCRRDPIHPNVIFYGSHRIPEDHSHSQTRRAAILCRAAFQFKRQYEKGILNPDVLNDEPLCSSSWKYIFNSCREPCKGCDRLRYYPGNDYVIALHRGHLFKVGLSSETGTDASINELETCFEVVLAKSAEKRSATAALTTDAREPWAAVSLYACLHRECQNS